MRWWKAGLVVIGLAAAALILMWLAQDFVPIEADDDGWLQDAAWLSPSLSSSKPPIAFSPDGQWEAISLSGFGEAAIIRISDERVVHILGTRGWAGTDVKAMGFSSNGQLIVVSEELPHFRRSGITVKVWQVADGKLVHSLKLWGGSRSSAALSPDGQMVALSSCTKEEGSGPSECIQSKIEIWRIADGWKMRTLWHDGDIYEMALSPNNQWLASSYCEKLRDRVYCAQSAIGIWDLRSNQKIRALLGNSSQPRTAVFSPDNQWLVSMGCSQSTLTGDGYGCAQGEIKLWRVADGASVHTLIGHRNEVDAAVFSADSQWLASASCAKKGTPWQHCDQGEIILWDIQSGQMVRSWKGHAFTIGSLAFSPDGHVLASWSGDATVKFWSTSDGSEMRTFNGQNSSAGSIAFSLDGKFLASSSGYNIKLMQAADGRLVKIFGAPNDSFTGFSPDGRFLVSRFQVMENGWKRERGGKVWSIPDGIETKVDPRKIHIVRSKGAAWGIAYSPDDQMEAWKDFIRMSGLMPVPFSENYVNVNRIDNNEQVYSVKHSDSKYDPVTDVVFSPDGRWLASGGWEGKGWTIKLWRATDGATEKTFKVFVVDHRDPGYGIAVTIIAEGGVLAFSPDAKLLAGAGLKEIKVWRISDGSLLYTIASEQVGNCCLTFSPDGQLMASGGVGEIKLWRVSDGQLLHTYRGHRRALKAMSFSPDGKLLASSGEDGIAVWKVLR